MKDPNGFGFFDVAPGQRPTGLLAHFGVTPTAAAAPPAAPVVDEHAGLTDEERALLQSDPRLATAYSTKLEAERRKVTAEVERAANVAAAHESHANLDRVHALAERVARGSK